MNRDILVLEQIRDALEIIISLTQNPDEIRWDAIKRLALERCFSITGEATKRLSPSLKEEHPKIPWEKMAAMRNVIVHEYDDLDIDSILDTSLEDVPNAFELINQILAKLDNDN